MRGPKPTRLDIDPANAAKLKRLATDHEAPYRVAVTEGRLRSDFTGRSWNVELRDGGPIDNTPVTQDDAVDRPSKREREARTR